MGDTNIGCNNTRGGDDDYAMMMMVVMVSPPSGISLSKYHKYSSR